jgi:hypothetical protein
MHTRLATPAGLHKQRCQTKWHCSCLVVCKLSSVLYINSLPLSTNTGCTAALLHNMQVLKQSWLELLCDVHCHTCSAATSSTTAEVSSTGAASRLYQRAIVNHNSCVLTA